MKTNVPKFKICRRLGPGVYEKCQTTAFAQSQANRGSKKGRGSKPPRQASEFALQLIEKQKVRLSYGLSEKQFSNYVKKSVETKANATEKLNELLEGRLDNVVYRLGLASTRRLARQLVSHGHFTVNGVKMTIPSYQVHIGDIVAIREGSKTKTVFQNVAGKIKNYAWPNWIKFDLEKGEGTVQGAPHATENYFNFNAVLEFYSR